MKTRNTIILAIILLILGGFYYIYDVQIGGKKEKEKTEKEKLFTFEKKDISAIDITKGKEKITFIKEGGVWKMSAPDKKMAASSAIDGIINTISGLKREATIDEKPSELTQFELKPPAVEITLSSGEKESQKKYTILLGSKIPSGNAYYAQIPGAAPVFTVASSISYEIDKKTEDLVEKEALPMDPSKVTSLEINYGDSQITLRNPQNFWTVLRKDAKWSITAPRAMKGDAGKISTFLWDIKNVKADRFITEAELKKYPSLEKEHTLTIAASQTEKPHETLVIGKPDKTGKLYPAKREPSGETFLIKDTDLKKLYKKAEDLQDTRIAIFEPKEVEQYEITMGDFKLQARRDKGEGWKITSPPKIRKNLVSLDSMLWKMENARFSGTMDDVKGKEALKNPEVSITLKGKDKSTIVALNIGKDPDDAKKTVVHCEPGSGEYFIADEEMLNQAKSIRDEVKSALGGPAAQPSPLKSASGLPSASPLNTAPQPPSPSPARSASGEAPGVPAASPSKAGGAAPVTSSTPAVSPAGGTGANPVPSVPLLQSTPEAVKGK